jgi:hypothetical protein
VQVRSNNVVVTKRYGVAVAVAWVVRWWSFAWLGECRGLERAWRGDGGRSEGQ